MRTRDFSFDLPGDLIAQHPAQRREQSRLLVLGRSNGAVRHQLITDLPGLLPPDCVLVLNNSKVRKARVYADVADKPREFLFLECGTRDGDEVWSAMTKRPAQLKPGTVVHLPGDRSAEVVGHDSQTVRLRIDGSLDEKYFDDVGHVPLPPYIKRDDEEADESRYQTIYASTPGSVAAPTAGLHMTGELLREIERRGIPLAFVTLHVGPGTFLPVRSDDPAEHVMHSERYQVTAETANTINGARADGRPIVAVGTTSVRTLESSYDPASSTVGAGQGATNLFIRPGYRFNVVSGLLTNFHTPESTLLMLVCAFAGRDSVLSAYGEAVRHRYRFFSYGDAMYIQ